MILVDEGTRRWVCGPWPDDARCDGCSGSELLLGVEYEMFGFFTIFGVSWHRRYHLVCRRCRTAVVVPTPRRDIELRFGNGVPYRDRFGLAALVALLVVIAIVFAVAGVSLLLNTAALAVLALVVYRLLRIGWASEASARAKSVR